MTFPTLKAALCVAALACPPQAQAQSPRKFTAQTLRGELVVTNPPWGERLEEQQRAGWLYYALGQVLGRLAPHWQALVAAPWQAAKPCWPP